MYMSSVVVRQLCGLSIFLQLCVLVGRYLFYIPWCTVYSVQPVVPGTGQYRYTVGKESI